MKIIRILVVTLIMMGCSAVRHADGWYPVADQPENKIEGKAIVTAKDFADVSLDTVSFPNMAVIEGKLKAEKVGKWAEATEERIGKRIGFVFNDSVVMAPTINCRIESGSFTIVSQDSALIRRIYNSLSDKNKWIHHTPVNADSIKVKAQESVNKCRYEIRPNVGMKFGQISV